MTNFTDLEATVLKAAITFFNYGDESEKDDNAVMFNLKELNAQTGIPVQSLKGVTGSLFKKGLFCEMEGGETGNLIEMGVTDEGIDAILELNNE